jgi:hypothetical protein
MMNIKFLVTLGLTTLVVLFAVSGALGAADTFTESFTVPFDTLVFIPCAGGGAGEVVSLSGSLHIPILFHSG